MFKYIFIISLFFCGIAQADVRFITATDTDNTAFESENSYYENHQEKCLSDGYYQTACPPNFEPSDPCPLDFNMFKACCPIDYVTSPDICTAKGMNVSPFFCENKYYCISKN